MSEPTSTDSSTESGEDLPTISDNQYSWRDKKMLRDLDIYRTAEMITYQYGDESLLEAIRRIEGYRTEGDENGVRVWGRIANTIESMKIPGDLTSTVH